MYGENLKLMPVRVLPFGKERSEWLQARNLQPLVIWFRDIRRPCKPKTIQYLFLILRFGYNAVSFLFLRFLYCKSGHCPVLWIAKSVWLRAQNRVVKKHPKGPGRLIDSWWLIEEVAHEETRLFRNYTVPPATQQSGICPRNHNSHFIPRSINIIKNARVWRTSHAVVQLVEALSYNPERHGFYSRWCHWTLT